MIKNIKELSGKELSEELTMIVNEMKEDTNKFNEYYGSLTKLLNKKNSEEEHKKSLENRLKNITPGTFSYNKDESKLEKIIFIISFSILMIIFGAISLVILIHKVEFTPEVIEIIQYIGAYIGCTLTFSIGITTLVKGFSDWFDWNGFIVRTIKSLFCSVTLVVILLIAVTLISRINQGIIIVAKDTAINMIPSAVISFIIYKIVKHREQQKSDLEYIRKKEEYDKQQEEKCKEKKEKIQNQIEESNNKILNAEKEIGEYRTKQPVLRNFEEELKDYIYKGYINVDILNDFILYLDKGMCDNLKECINTYEQEIKLNNMKKDQENFRKNINRKLEEEKENMDKKLAEANAQIEYVQAQTNAQIEQANAQIEHVQAQANERINKVGKRLSWTDEQNKDIDSITGKK